MHAKKQVSFLGPILLGLCLVVPGGSSVADECKASLKSTLKTEERGSDTITYKFKVDVRAPERCADVDYVLEVVEAVPGEEDRAKKISRRTRVRDGVSVSAKVNYKMPRAHRLVRWDFEVVRCKLCGAAKLD